MIIIRDAFATLTQRIKNSQFFKNDQKNIIHNDRIFLNKSNFNSRKKLDSRVENMRKHKNNEIDLITKIIAIISFVYFNESRVKRAIIRKTTKTITIFFKFILDSTLLKVYARFI